ncbi:MAG: prolyl oligopeptidase family serine peptidase [Rhizomicrobium sp.]
MIPTLRRCAVLAAAIALGCFASVAEPPAAGAPHPVTLDDMTAMESVQRIEIAGGGRFVLYDKHGPNEGFTDYGIDDPSASSRIYVYDRAAGTTRRLLDGFAFPNWMGAVSPSGGKLAIYWFENGHVKAGVVDLAGGKLTGFAFTPTFDFQVSAPVWVSDSTLIYAADPDGAFSPRTDFRRRAALIQEEGQRRAWQGGSSAMVLENRPAGTLPEWRPGSLLRVDADSGKTETLADGHYVEIALSPDRRFLAVARQGHFLPFTTDVGKQVFDLHRLEPFVIDLAHPHAAAAMCPHCQLGGIGDFAWSPSGHRVSFFARFGKELWERARFHVYDADRKILTEIPHVGLDLASQREITGALNGPVTAIPFGAGALMPARKQADPKAAPIFTLKDPVSLARMGIVRSGYKATLGRLDWYYVEPDGSSRALTAGLDDVQPSSVASDPGGLYFMGTSKVTRLAYDGKAEEVATLAGFGMIYKLDGSVDAGGHSLAVSMTPDGGRVLQFFEGTKETGRVKAGAETGFPLAADAASGVVVLEGSSAQGTVITLMDRDGHVTTIASLNTHLKQVLPAKTVMVKYTLPSGEALQSCVLLPPGAPAGKPLPTIVSVYPGAMGCFSTWQHGLGNPYDEELFTGLGYAVLKPATPANLLRQGDDPTAHWGALVEAAVNAAAAQGYVDKSRLGLWGLSHGGHSGLSTLSQTSIFKAGVVANSATDFFSHYGTLGVVRTMLSDDLFAAGSSTLYESAPEEGLYIGAAPWEKPQAYAVASPLSHAGQMNTPLLMLAGDLDWNYQPSEFDQYYVALIRQGKEATYVRYLGEGHGNTSPANLSDSWQRIRDWFASHIK